MVDFIRGVVGMSAWAWVAIVLILAIIVVIIIKSDVAEVLSKLSEKLFGPSFHVIGRRLGAFWRTKTGKAILPIIGLSLIGVLLWYFLASPAIDSIATAAQQREHNVVAANAYNKVPEVDHCVVMGNPYAHNKPVQEIEAWREDQGNRTCFQVHVTSPEETKRAWLGIRTMEFQACKSNDGIWIFERTALLLGDFKDDDDYMVSMKKVAGILKDQCSKKQQEVAVRVTQPEPIVNILKKDTSDSKLEGAEEDGFWKATLTKVTFWK